MRKSISIIMIIVFAISMCSAALYAEEAVFEGEAVFEEDVFEEVTVFEDSSNWDEEESVTEDSVAFNEEYVFEDYSLADSAEEITIWEDDQGVEAVSSDEAGAYENENLLSDDSYLLEEEIINEDSMLRTRAITLLLPYIKCHKRYDAPIAKTAAITA